MLSLEGISYISRTMPRRPRLDAPGALHHVMTRGIEGKKIFRNRNDYEDFLSRLEQVVSICRVDIEVLMDSDMRAGYHSVVWNGENAASGIYFYRMRTGEFTDTKRMLLLK